jgi:hypothetical protein
VSEKRDWVTIGSLTIVGVAAAVTSFSAQADLATVAGWPDWMSWLLPATDDVYGVAATRMWLAADSSDELRRHARAHAAGALILSMAGNAMDHALNKGAIHLGSHLWLLVVAVSLVPPIALGALMHLVTLRGRDQTAPNPVRVKGGHDSAAGANATGGHKPVGGQREANIMGPRPESRVGANTTVAPSPVAPRETVVAPAKVAPADEGGRLLEFAPRGETQATMRTHWAKTIADGFIPSGADLNRAADKDPKYSLGKKYAKAWGEELPEEFVEAVKAGRHEKAREIAAGFSAGERKEVAT